jgi:hypothetical protein
MLRLQASPWRLLFKDEKYNKKVTALKKLPESWRVLIKLGKVLIKLSFFLLILFSLPAMSAQNEAKDIDLLMLGADNVKIYDNWDLSSSRMNWIKETDNTVCQITVSPIANISYFGKGLAIDLKSKELQWDDFDFLKFKLKTDISADYIKATILESDGEYWTAAVPFKGKNKNSYVIKKDAFAYGWGGPGTKTKDSHVALLLISVEKGVKPSQEIQMWYEDVHLGKGSIKENPGEASTEASISSEWDFSKIKDDDTLGWQSTEGLSEFVITDGAINTKVKKQFPYTASHSIDIDAGKYRYLVIKMKINGQGSGTLGTYFTTATITTMTAATNVSTPITYNGTVQTYVLDLNTCKEWKGKVTSFRLDFYFGVGQNIQISYIGFKNILPETKDEAGRSNFIEQGSVTFEVDAATGYEKSEALKIFLSGKSSRGFWSVTKTDFLPSENYKVTGYYRNDNKFPEDGKNLVQVIFLNEDGKAIKNLLEEPRLQEVKETNWKKVKLGFKIPEDAVEMKVCLGAEAVGGTAQWSKIRITKTDAQNSALDKDSWQANWIKFPEKYPPDNTCRYFRKEISAGNDIAEAPLQITADDSFWLYINGILRYEYNVHDGWMNVQKMDMAPYLKPGKNIVAIKLWNKFGYTGLLFECALNYATGKTQKTVSDDSWKTTDKDIAGWNMLDFNDNNWAAAEKIGTPPVPPWGKIPYINVDSKNIFVLEKTEIPIRLKSGEPLNLSLPIRLKTNIKPDSETKMKIWITDANKVPFWQTEENVDISSVKGDGKNVLLKFSVPTNNFTDGKYQIYATLNNAKIFTASGTTDSVGIGSVQITGNDKKQKQTMICEVRDFNGIPMIHINGKPTFLNAYECAYNSDRTFDYFIKDFSEQAGFNLYFLQLAKAIGRGVTSLSWIGPGKYDFSEIDRIVSKILSINPQAKLVLSYGVDAPEWWNKLHPEELVNFAGGENSYLSSPASALWRKESGEAFRQFIRHVENSSYAPCVIGYRAAAHDGGGEWQFIGGWEGKLADYSTPMKVYFQEWLRGKYGKDTQKLRAAWNNPNIDFGMAAIPSQSEREKNELFTFRNPEKCRNVIDYLHCHSDVIADAILFFAKISKEEVPHKLFGVYGSYIFAYTGSQILNNGHLSYMKVYDSPYIDFVSGATDYSMRAPGEPSGFYSPSESLAIRGKLWIMEADLRTFLSGDDGIFNQVKNLRQAIGTLKREFGMELTRGYGMYWFDMVGGWYANKGMMESIRKMKIIGDNSLHFKKKYSPEVAVFYSTESAYCLKSNPWDLLRPLVFEQRLNLGYIGTPYAQHYIEDILRPDFPKYKCYIFLNAFNLDERLRTAIKENLQKDNNVLVWLYAPGFFKDSEKSVANMKEITGININCLEKEEELSVEIMNVKHPLVEGLSGTLIGGSKTGPVFYADNTDSITLGKISSNGKAGLAIKNMGNWTSIYSSVPALPEELWRRIAKFSGAHIYTAGGDPLYTDGRFLVIHARTGGEKEIILQNKTSVYDVFKDETIARNTDKIKVNIPQYKTEIYFLGEEKEWKEFLGK